MLDHGRGEESLKECGHGGLGLIRTWGLFLQQEGSKIIDLCRLDIQGFQGCQKCVKHVEFCHDKISSKHNEFQHDKILSKHLEFHHAN